MSKGTWFPSESRTFRDYRTGNTIHQLTDHESINHHPFFLIPAYDRSMHWILFLSHRTGYPSAFVIERETGRILQLTDRPDLAEWSVNLSRNGKFLFYVAGQGAWQSSIHSLKKEELFRFETGDLRLLKNFFRFPIDRFAQTVLAFWNHRIQIGT